jgi:hypothetical protein
MMNERTDEDDRSHIRRKMRMIDSFTPRWFGLDSPLGLGPTYSHRQQVAIDDSRQGGMS